MAAPIKMRVVQQLQGSLWTRRLSEGTLLRTSSRHLPLLASVHFHHPTTATSQQEQKRQLWNDSTSARRTSGTRSCTIRTLSTTTTKETSTSNNETASADINNNIHEEELEFKAETRQILDIVTNSLYTDKEVFLRELVSNASDALEKLRHMKASGQVVTATTATTTSTSDDNKSETSATATSTDAVENVLIDPDLDLEIRIDLDEVTSTITDTGLGMTREQMISHLGTIARSGSKQFAEQIQRMDAAAQKASGASSLPDPSRGIIGKFGVGFYSAFMVADRVEFRSKYALTSLAQRDDDSDSDEQPQVVDNPAQVWTSDGSGKYKVADLDDTIRQLRGSSIVLHMKPQYWHFIDENTIERVLRKYSNFINFPIYLNGTLVNTLEAIWTKDPKQIEPAEYTEFYKYIASAVDEPLDVYHFRADAPIDVKALFFVPSFHSEKYGMGRMEPGVSLYSRKILIEQNCVDLLPDWMRFVKGVVDSEDLPLAISREKTQDRSLLTKLRSVLTRKFIAHLAKLAKDDKEKYVDEFFREYAFFLKEGICQDYEFQGQLSKLVYYESSKNVRAKLVSLDEYIARMRPEQKDIYYLVAPTREAALHSPYLEGFTKAGVEVLFLFSAVDDFVMANLKEYEGRKLVSVEKGDIDLSAFAESSSSSNKDDSEVDLDADDEELGTDKIFKSDRKLTDAELLEFCSWFPNAVGTDKVASCTVTKRLYTSPAIVTDNESGAMRRMMRLVDTSDGNEANIPLPKQHVEINAQHPVIVGIFDLIHSEPKLAKVLASQVYDNCLVAAGLLDDGRAMLPRLNDILLCVVNGAKTNNSNKQQLQEQQEDSDVSDKGPTTITASSKDDKEETDSPESPRESTSKETN